MHHQFNYNLLIILTFTTSLNIENLLNEDEIMNKSNCYSRFEITHDMKLS